ncbi:hypothetical protein NKH77_18680 [Streptomyces sp. M19]
MALTRGAWPRAAGANEPVQVALPETAADRLGVRPGRTVRLADRVDDAR